jgi:hypothetical protein
MNATWVGKVGGSLLDPPDFPELALRLARVVEERGGARPILIVGGGQGVDIVRRWDHLFGLGEEASHWIAVRLLSINSRMVERIVPDTVLVHTVEDCESAWRAGQAPIYDCFAFLSSIDESRADPLPWAWKVTSDSIAARVAEHFGAPELMLLKSASAPAALPMARAVEEGFVDGFFCDAASRIPERVAINLRDDPAVVSRLV